MAKTSLLRHSLDRLHNPIWRIEFGQLYEGLVLSRNPSSSSLPNFTMSLISCLVTSMFMLGAGNTRIFKRSCKPAFDNQSHITPATPQHIDTATV
jgi:hypothetical protein